MTDAASSDAALRPLLRWAEPLLAAARARTQRLCTELARAHPAGFDADGLCASIADAYAAPALASSARALLLELAIARHDRSLRGETPQARFADFLRAIESADGRAAIDRRFSLLRDDVARQAAQTERVLSRQLHRWQADHAAFAALFPRDGEGPGRLLGFATDLGDRHHDGATVCRLVCEGGPLLYKPRSLALDAAFARLLDIVSEDDRVPTQRVARVLDRGDYGYVEWIENAPLPAGRAVDYYRRYGGLCALAYLLHCADLHFENVVAAGEFPVLVDLETLFQPTLPRAQGGATDAEPRVASVLFSGLLPSAHSMPEGSDLSALSAARYRVRRRVPVDAGTDALRLAETEVELCWGGNLPRDIDGVAIAPQDHAADIVAGFEATYRRLLALRPRLRAADGPLAPFAPLRTRTVLRSTRIYVRLLDAMSHPQYLRSSQARDAVLDRLDAGVRDCAALAQLVPSERRALQRGDVPHFTVAIDGDEVGDGDGTRIGFAFASSGWREVQRRLRELSLRDLARQRYAVAQSIESLRAPGDAKAVQTPVLAPFPRPAASRTPPADHPGRFLAEAVAIGDTLLALAFRDRRGIGWLQLEYDRADRVPLTSMGLTLYEGLPGVLLLFAELARCSGRARFTRAAEAVLVSARARLRADPDALETIGAYAGLGGWIYVLLWLGLRWRRAALFDEAAAWLPHLVARIGRDDAFDIVGGAAGCLSVLTDWQRLRPAPQIEAAAAACAAHLKASAREDGQGVYWPAAELRDRGFTAMAHGTAGIGAVLARHGHAAADADCVALAHAALRYERAAYRTRGARWCDDVHAQNPETAGDPLSWCHGAPGVGLARAWWPAPLRDARSQDELDACLHATLAHTQAGGDSLCHGRLGNLDLPLVQAIERGDGALLARARAIGATILSDAAVAGWRCGGRSAAEHPLGLMIGLAGIGYGCLRLADPEATPSVLNLSLPAASA